MDSGSHNNGSSLSSRSRSFLAHQTARSRRTNVLAMDRSPSRKICASHPTLSPWKWSSALHVTLFLWTDHSGSSGLLRRRGAGLWVQSRESSGRREGVSRTGGQDGSRERVQRRFRPRHRLPHRLGRPSHQPCPQARHRNHRMIPASIWVQNSVRGELHAGQVGNGDSGVGSDSRRPLRVLVRRASTCRRSPTGPDEAAATTQPYRSPAFLATARDCHRIRGLLSASKRPSSPVAAQNSGLTSIPNGGDIAYAGPATTTYCYFASTFLDWAGGA